MQDNSKTTPPTKEDAQRTQSRPSPAAVDGRDKTATFRQLMSNRLVLTQMLALYREYGLVE